MIPELQQLGFTRNEANVFSSLLRLGPCSVQQLAHATGLNRITVHSITEKFETMQIVLSTYQGKRRRITPVDPAQLQLILRREEETLHGKQEALQSILPSLAQLFHSAQRGLQVQTFRGEEGLQRICDDVLTSDTEILEYANIDQLNAAIGSYIVADYLPNKHKLQLRTKFLFVDTPGAHAYIKKNYIDHPGAAPMEVKFIGTDFFGIDAYLVIYSDKVAILTPSTMDAVIIKDKGISDSLRPFFNFVWQRAGDAMTNVLRHSSDSHVPITEINAQSKSFDFLKEEPDLYSHDDIKPHT